MDYFDRFIRDIRRHASRLEVPIGWYSNMEIFKAGLSCMDIGLASKAGAALANFVKTK